MIYTTFRKADILFMCMFKISQDQIMIEHKTKKGFLKNKYFLNCALIYIYIYRYSICLNIHTPVVFCYYLK